MLFGYFHTQRQIKPSSSYQESIDFPFGSLFLSDFKVCTWDSWSLYYTGTICNLDQLQREQGCTSTAELFVQLLNQKGIEFFREFYGPFFMVLLNRKENKIVFVNNNHQMTHLYYNRSDRSILLANRLEGILPLLEKVEVYKPSIRSFVANGFTLSDEIQIQGVKKLLPSHAIFIDESGVEFKNYWKSEYKSERKEFKNLEEKLNLYEETYRKSMEGYLTGRKAKKIGALLSGGHDTSFALIQTKQATKEPVSAYTITFPGWNFSEEGYARNIANKFDAEFNPVPIGPESLDSVMSLIRNVEEPVVGVALPLHVLGQKASADGVDTIIGGDGGDTLWGEYYPVAEVHKYIKHWSRDMRSFAHKATDAIAKAIDWERLWELEHVLSLFDKENYYEDFLTQLCTYRHFRLDQQKMLFNSDFFEDGSVAKSSYQIPFNKENFQESLIEGKLFNGFFTYMSFSQTKLFGQQGLEFFMPTVQRPIRDFITTLPMNWVNGGSTFQRLTNSKAINRRFHKVALSRYLKREEIYNRSFDIPWYNILGPRKHTLNLLKNKLIRRGWYQKTYLENLFSEFESQKVKDYELLELKHHGYRIFTLLSLEIWCSLYLDGKYKQALPTSLDEFLEQS